MGSLTQIGLERGAIRDCWTGIVDGEIPKRAAPEMDSGKIKALETEERLAWLSRAIETEIIPRLMLVHRETQQGLTVPAANEGSWGREQIVEFARIVMNEEVRVASKYVEELRSDGTTLESLYLDFLAPTARYLGELWEEDICDFADVTLGLWRLQQVLHDLSPDFRNEYEPQVRGRRILLVPTPGEQHTLGLLMVTEFFRRAGWDVCGKPEAATADLADVVSKEWFDVIGFSAGSDCRLDEVRAVILAIRQASCNPDVSVMVGGPIFNQHPEYIERVGADASAQNAKQAIFQAESLVSQQERQQERSQERQQEKRC